MNVRAVSRWFGAAALVIGPLGLVLGALVAVAGDNDSVSVSLAKIAAIPPANAQWSSVTCWWRSCFRRCFTSCGWPGRRPHA